ncbi:MAG: LysE family transporter [Synergistaceae bacterium]|nr:LysE family transporter [Synergistaceae bacterium]
MLDVILSYLPYALITTFTPGPNNLMSLYSVSSYGWRKGGRVILGIALGFTVVMVMVILFCHELAKYIPGLVGWLKYFGAAYILWLAWHIAVSVPSDSGNASAGFRNGLLLALSNVKVILYLITIFTAYVIPSGAELADMFIHRGLIIAVSAVSWCTWGAAGGMMQRFLSEHYRAFSIAMGIALLWCAANVVM